MNDDFNPYAAPSIPRSEPTETVLGSAAPDQLHRIAVGLDFIRASQVVFLVDVFAGITVIAILRFGEGPSGVHPLVFLGFETALVVGHCLWLFGSSRCVASPLSAHAHPLVVATIIAQMLSLVLTIGSFLNVRPIGGRSTQEFVAAVGCMTFILFLRKLSQHLGRPDLARRAAMLLIVWGVLAIAIAGAFVTFLIMVNNAPHRRGAANLSDIQTFLAATALAVLLLGTGGVIGYFNLLRTVKSAILESSRSAGASSADNA